MSSDTHNIDYPDLAYIDPKDLNDMVMISALDDELRKSILGKNAEPKISDGDWDQTLPKKFQETDVYISLYEHFQNGKPWEETELFERVSKDMNAGLTKWGCKTPEKYLRRLENDVDTLFESIKQNGYLTQIQLESEKYSDEIRVIIDRTGKMLFLDGRHRLAISKILGLKKVPVKIILRHSAWAQFQQTIANYAKRNNNMIYQNIEHPDLHFFRAKHKDNRFEMLSKYIKDYDCFNKELIDIGTHWGHMCHKFEELGFKCHAIEKLVSNIQYLEGIRDACGKTFEIWQGNIFDYPNIEQMDVILALNILHHFCKTESLHNKLIGLLKRIDADFMLFQAHRHDPPGQMADAFRNYTENEFIDFIIEHTVFTDSVKIGVASDGRPLFKLWR